MSFLQEWASKSLRLSIHGVMSPVLGLVLSDSFVFKEHTLKQQQQQQQMTIKGMVAKYSETWDCPDALTDWVPIHSHSLKY